MKLVVVFVVLAVFSVAAFADEDYSAKETSVKSVDEFGDEESLIGDQAAEEQRHYGGGYGGGSGGHRGGSYGRHRNQGGHGHGNGHGHRRGQGFRGRRSAEADETVVEDQVIEEQRYRGSYGGSYGGYGVNRHNGNRYGK